MEDAKSLLGTAAGLHAHSYIVRSNERKDITTDAPSGLLGVIYARSFLLKQLALNKKDWLSFFPLLGKEKLPWQLLIEQTFAGSGSSN